MNDEARAELDRITAMEPEALTEGEKAFLMARRADLSEEQRIKFAISDEASADSGTPSPRSRKAAVDEATK
jgi:hypothetical protein